ncbi:MAG: NrfD/PsrC family molybdoenzyme membrane anchor subunit [Syntrophales bacterium]
MIQTRLYEFMVSYTPQTEWIDKGGVKLWLAFFFIELGAGMFFIASLFDNIVAMTVGWIFCEVLGGGLHLLYLGKPFRFWRMALSSGWKTSWISRGIMFVSLFFVLGAIHIILLKSGVRVTGFLIAADIFAFLTVIYGGFAMNYVNGISLWNTALLPVLYGVSGLWGGAELTLGIALATGAVEIGPAIEEWIRILLAGYLFLIPVYLISVRYTSKLGQVTIRYMVFGKWSPIFWGVVVALGMVVPSISVIVSLAVGIEGGSMALLYAAVLSGLIGDLAMRYLLLKCGLYSPLVPTRDYSENK